MDFDEFVWKFRFFGIVIDEFGSKFEWTSWLLTCFDDNLLILDWTGENQLTFNWTGYCQPEILKIQIIKVRYIGIFEKVAQNRLLTSLLHDIHRTYCKKIQLDFNYSLFGLYIWEIFELWYIRRVPIIRPNFQFCSKMEKRKQFLLNTLNKQPIKA